MAFPELIRTEDKRFKYGVAREIVFSGMNVFATDTTLTTQAQYDAMKAKGFNCQRLVFHWDDLETSSGTFNTAFRDKIDDCIDRAKLVDIYTFICPTIDTYYSDTRFPSWVPVTGSNECDRLVTYIGPLLRYLMNRYINDNAVVGLMAINEPNGGAHGGGSPDWTTAGVNKILSMHASLIGQVRQAGGDPTAKKLYSVSGPDGGAHPVGSVSATVPSPSGVAGNAALLTDKANVFFELHTYFGGSDDDGFSSAGGQAGKYYSTTPDVNDKYPHSTNPRATAKSQLRTHLRHFKTWAHAAGLPLIVGEFGKFMNEATTPDYFEDLTAICKETEFNQLGRLQWRHHTNGDAFASKSNATTWRPAMDKMVWTDWFSGTDPPGGTDPPSSSLAVRGQSATARTTAGTTLDLAKPAGVVEGDVMVAMVQGTGSNTVTITPPAGWTLISGMSADISTFARTRGYYKIATGSEPASYQWTFSLSAEHCGGLVACYDMDQSAPLNAAAIQANSGTLTPMCPSVTTTRDNCLLLFGIATTNGTTFAFPVGAEELFDLNTGGILSSDRTICGGAEAHPASGTTGTRTITDENPGGFSGDASVGFMVAFSPTPPPPPPPPPDPDPPPPPPPEARFKDRLLLGVG